MYELGGVRVTQPTHLTCFQYSRIRREDAAALGVRVVSVDCTGLGERACATHNVLVYPTLLAFRPSGSAPPLHLFVFDAAKCRTMDSETARFTSS